MNQRILQFLAAENITQAQFADTIEVARATVSHVIAGRNKPGFDFIESISHHYPDLNIEWLITGKGKMYKSNGVENIPAMKPQIQKSTSNDELFSFENDSLPSNEEAITSEIAAAESAFRRAVEKTHPVAVQTNKPAAPEPALPRMSPKPAPSAEIRINKGERHISKIIVLYDDNSFQEIQ